MWHFMPRPNMGAPSRNTAQTSSVSQRRWENQQTWRERGGGERHRERQRESGGEGESETKEYPLSFPAALIGTIRRANGGGQSPWQTRRPESPSPVSRWLVPMPAPQAYAQHGTPTSPINSVTLREKKTPLEKNHNSSYCNFSLPLSLNRLLLLTFFPF